jgi:hypothetical protein
LLADIGWRRLDVPQTLLGRADEVIEQQSVFAALHESAYDTFRTSQPRPRLSASCKNGYQHLQ